MFQTSLKIKENVFFEFFVAVLALLLVVATGAFPAQASVKAGRQQTYGTPEAAVEALMNALKSKDRQQVAAVLGPGSREILSSGDETEDRALLENFVRLYDQKNKMERVGKSQAVLLVGEKDWPMPIPVVKKGRRWLFDTRKGKEEVLNRRIGRNELAVIKVCEAYVDAQQEFALKDTDGDGLFEYAQKFWSSPGKKDGLYWETKEGEKPSPLGPFAARAKAEGYEKSSATDEPRPYHGYFYRILKGQGAHAPGGAYDYVVKGNMIGGFALVAYPAQYGISGVMTFVVNQDGVVYQKNLGKATAKTARAMTLFDPDQTWKKVEPAAEGTTAGDAGRPGAQGEKE